MVDPRRIRSLNDGGENIGTTIAYWMSRDQRVADNWALTFAQNRAEQEGKELIVLFSLVPTFPGATLRHYDFMLKGLEEVEKRLHELNIPFILLEGTPDETIPEAIQKYNVSTLVTDFSPLRIGRAWRRRIADSISVPFFEVDTHNIVPIWEASDKQEFAAYTIRPKINKQLQNYLTDIPPLNKQSQNLNKISMINWSNLRSNLTCNNDVKPVNWITPGEEAACETLRQFITKKLTSDYAEKRNDPTEDMLSNLSPYLHFGQISAQRVAWEVKKADAPQADKDAFLEELIVRKELADNYCFYNDNYDNEKGFPSWAKDTLKEHERDSREFIYSKEQFERAETNDPYWNAAQMEMVKTGKMHGYMRMYWAKKILEWTKNAKEAMEIAVYLNDTYELDGRDPNGYAGCTWSIGGVHDRAWFERPVFGKIRYMNANGLKRKFDIEKYVEKVTGGKL